MGIINYPIYLAIDGGKRMSNKPCPSSPFFIGAMFTIPSHGRFSMFFPHFWRLSPSMLTFFAVELVEYHPWKSVLNQPVYRDDTGFWTPSILMNSGKKTTGRSADSWRCAALVNSLFLGDTWGLSRQPLGYQPVDSPKLGLCSHRAMWGPCVGYNRKLSVIFFCIVKFVCLLEAESFIPPCEFQCLLPKIQWFWIIWFLIPPLVNVYITMENHHF